MDSRGGIMDPTRDVAFMSDAELSNFFQRPIKIYENNWAVGTPLDVQFNPWSLFWNDPRNLARIDNYHLLKCNLHLKVLINGNAFYYGRALVAYEPLHPLDDTSAARNRNWLSEDFVRGSQRQHIWLNPTCSQGGELKLPFFWHNNALSIQNADWDFMGECRLVSLNDLKHANGSTQAIPIVVYAWAEDVSYAIPTRSGGYARTSRVPFSLPVPEADEYTKPIVSQPASTIARISGALANLPVIGPFARATEMGANSVAAIARIFGYSAPVELQTTVIVPYSKRSLATTDNHVEASKLTVDSKQELTLDPTTTGIPGNDELAISSIATKESYLTSFPWNIADGTDVHLFNTVVDPGLKRFNATNSEVHLTACSMAVAPFKYWRGTMRFRFQIVSSEYHKGRLRIVYDPYSGGATAPYNTVYTKILDIADQKDFSMDIGWAQSVPYREHIPVTTEAPHFSTAPLGVYQLFGNGVLSVYVMNKLTTPSDVVQNDIEINVFVSMLDDLEVACPTDDISKLRTNPTPATPPVRSLPPPSVSHSRQSLPRPEADDVPTDDDNQECEHVTDPPVIHQFADTYIDQAEHTKLFFGEVIGSFRQLLKRFYLHEKTTFPVNTLAAIHKMERPAFPYYGGFVEDAGASISKGVLQPYGTDSYAFAQTTLVNYLSRAFLGWRGSHRWLIDGSYISSYASASDNVNALSFIASRNQRGQIRNTSNELDHGTALFTAMSRMMEVSRSSTFEGASVWNTSVNPFHTIEIPYYHETRFTPTFLAQNFATESVEPGFQVVYESPPRDVTGVPDWITLYHSVGEDFNLFFFNGMPPLYIESSYPA